MKRSEINALIRSALECFAEHSWALPPHPRWDVTDFGLGDWRKFGLVLVNLAEHSEYCEKLMLSQSGMTTPAHTHARKKEDIVCRWGELGIRVWKGRPENVGSGSFELLWNGVPKRLTGGELLRLAAGERVTLTPGIYHEFAPISDECIIGEVSTANDDLNDNYFVDSRVGRFPMVEEDEPPILRLISDSGSNAG